jgi:hypothetical protein
MTITKLIATSGLILGFNVYAALAGPLDPDCTPEKAAKSAAMKGTVGIGGRCDPKETAKDTAKRTAGVEEKGPIEKHKKKNDTPAEKARDAARNVGN